MELSGRRATRWRSSVARMAVPSAATVPLDAGRDLRCHRVRRRRCERIAEGEGVEGADAVREEHDAVAAEGGLAAVVTGLGRRARRCPVERGGVRRRDRLRGACVDVAVGADGRSVRGEVGERVGIGQRAELIVAHADEAGRLQRGAGGGDDCQRVQQDGAARESGVGCLAELDDAVGAHAAQLVVGAGEEEPRPVGRELRERVAAC